MNKKNKHRFPVRNKVVNNNLNHGYYSIIDVVLRKIRKKRNSNEAFFLFLKLYLSYLFIHSYKFKRAKPNIYEIEHRPSWLQSIVSYIVLLKVTIQTGIRYRKKSYTHIILIKQNSHYF